jgi:hypothetical protein
MYVNCLVSVASRYLIKISYILDSHEDLYFQKYREIYLISTRQYWQIHHCNANESNKTSKYDGMKCASQLYLTPSGIFLLF